MFFRCEHLLIMICVEIALDHNACDGRHRSSDYVMDVQQELSNSDFTLLNVLSRLSLSITVSDQVAL